ncbi:LysR family transcriptional regulator [Orbus sturtevantii]|uniref:LysR family transcriptional regulator n=1 Tax=Orbus sturtevantii TaxID=3074109 RepID=UPI00370DA904
MQKYSRKLPSVKQLQYFLAVCEELNFRKAAAKLNITQPPLSLQIKELENKLNTCLIIRNTQNVVLTKDGELLRDKASALLEEICSITNVFRTDEIPKIVIGMTKTLSYGFIPILTKFMLHFTENSTVYKDSYTSKELLIELEKNNMDFVVTSFYPHEDNKMFYRLIHQEPMILVLPDDHPASNDDLVDLNSVIDLPLYWFNRNLNPSYYDQCEKVFKNLSSPLIRRTELPDTLSMLLEISQGKGMLFMPKSTTQAKIPGVTYKKFIPYFEKKFLINIFLVWNTSTLENQHARNIIDFFNK